MFSHFYTRRFNKIINHFDPCIILFLYERIQKLHYYRFISLLKLLFQSNCRLEFFHHSLSWNFFTCRKTIGLRNFYFHLWMKCFLPKRWLKFLPYLDKQTHLPRKLQVWFPPPKLHTSKGWLDWKLFFFVFASKSWKSKNTKNAIDSDLSRYSKSFFAVATRLISYSNTINECFFFVAENSIWRPLVLFFALDFWWIEYAKELLLVLTIF